MPVVELRTMILAPIGRCFDLARSIEFHVVSAARTQETAVRGRTKGLIELGETVTWRARHLGIWQELTVEITILDRPRHFQDAMTKGAFALMKHDHYFDESKGLTEMFDKFMYRAPLALLEL
jgi:ligand-binding SRPBCC domain-containing protein